MQLWEKIEQLLEANRPCALLYVLRSEGSSPGRQGFSMVVDEKEIHGSIGGGFMEHKLVELARSRLREKNTPFIKRQVHRKDVAEDQSGMICSGEQTVAFYFLLGSDLLWVRKVVRCLDEDGSGILTFTEKGADFTPAVWLDNQFALEVLSESAWKFQEQIGHKNTIYILGGGHVGLALSTVMAQLGFFVEQFDDREALNTMVNNHHAHRKRVIQYDEIEKYIQEGNRSFVTLVSFGYRTDKVLLKKLIGRKYRYLGMMGSGEKVKQLFDELRKEGVGDEMLARVHSPIGILIQSKTPEEIAVSIAAEIIKVKNSST